MDLNDQIINYIKNIDLIFKTKQIQKSISKCKNAPVSIISGR
jgi:hypothetical protein